jgi:hypothetical protein
MRIKIVIAGYYYGREFYSKISDINKAYEEVNVTIISHKVASEIPQEIMALIEFQGFELRIENNEGWDWGAFCQFARTLDTRSSDFEYVLFMHDDTLIKDISFVDKLTCLASDGYVAVGNSKPRRTVDNYDKKYANEYVELLSKGFEPVKNFPVFRGSFVFLTRKLVLGVLAHYEYKKLGPIENANISLRQVASLLGLKTDDCHLYHYLGEKYLDSDFIAEFERGKKQGVTQRVLSHLKLLLFASKSFVRICLEKTGFFAELPNNKVGNDLFINISDSYYFNGFLNVGSKTGFDLQNLSLIKWSSLKDPCIYIYLDYNMKNLLPTINDYVGISKVYLYTDDLNCLYPYKRKKSLGRLFKNKRIFKI